jgi:hypothetical protein
MPTRKQRRRRAKEQRHEWEYVEIDPETGEERALEASELRADKDGTKKKQPAPSRGGRALRPVPPPSWNRTAKRALPFAALLIIAMLVIAKDAPVPARILYGIFYGALLFPFMYWTDRMSYRMYLKRSGQAPPPRQKTS